MRSWLSGSACGRPCARCRWGKRIGCLQLRKFGLAQGAVVSDVEISQFEFADANPLQFAYGKVLFGAHDANLSAASFLKDNS